jgi:hypothetical protein
MITPREIYKGLKNPRRGIFELYRRIDQSIFGNEAVAMVEEDWDTLIILDACRYDLLAETDPFDAPVEKKTSPATYTKGFLKKTFDDGDFPETVFVSANPHFESINARFHKRISLWEEEWDEKLGVTPPRAVTEAAINTFERHPEKRLIVHYMQPHYPFIGDIGQRMKEQGIIHYKHSHGDDFWRQLKDETVDADMFRKAYKQNLEVTIPHVQELIEMVPGKTIITSDHGNEFGRFGIYGHPAWAYSRGLVTIPWVVLENNQRRTITPGRATEGPGKENSKVQERLAQLGYAEN